MLKLVTLTGADNSVKPEDLLALSQKYPFVEWGILVSAKQFGNPRWPTMEWMGKLVELVINGNLQVNLSMHLCGQYVRNVLKGDTTAMIEQLKFVWPIFTRVQINTHAIPHEYNTSFFDFMRANALKQFILQYDNANNNMLMDAVRSCKNVQFLYDMSHGAGILPGQWPASHKSIINGYAGGLGPQNVEQELHRINAVASGDNGYWIDMETHIRDTYPEDIFSLPKCEEVLRLMKPYA